MEFCKIEGGNLWLFIKVKPNSKAFKISINNNELKIHITAIAEDGKANKELISKLSSIFNTPKGSIEIAKGLTIPNKTIVLRNISLTKNEVLTILGFLQ
jgi:uncharacterized protein (TIGR00251 family)